MDDISQVHTSAEQFTRQSMFMSYCCVETQKDHANKTVTLEPHTHIPGPPRVSIHPCKSVQCKVVYRVSAHTRVLVHCRHADVMKKIIETVAEGGSDLGVHMYPFVFLSFVTFHLALKCCAVSNNYCNCIVP